MVAFIIVKTDSPGEDEKTGMQLSEITGVQEVHHVAGEDGFIVKIRVADTAELGEIIRGEIASLKSVRSTRTTIVMSTFKETARIPIQPEQQKKEVNSDQN